MNASRNKTACILCSVNCGLEVEVVADPKTARLSLARIHGDRDHPTSRGYTCEKALRLDHYQNGPHRLRSPLRRRHDGTFEEISWDRAITEIAERFLAQRQAYGGESIFYYGGGGQGNHLGGAYGRATRAALGSVYTSNALAQEKTGEFFIDGRLFGRPRCHTTGDFEHAEVALFVGKNPWHSHGFPRARVILKEIAQDPARSLIVIDPRRTETAALADIHLQVRPGTDAFCLSALLALLVKNGWVDQTFLAAHTTGYEDLRAALLQIPIAEYCDKARIPFDLLQTAAERIAKAKSVSTMEDLGIQQAPNSTLNSYLEKLIYLLTGNFGKKGAMNIHTRFASLGGGGGGGGTPKGTPVTGQRIITGLIPANAIPEEILTDHPRRFRSMLVESANPAHSLSDSKAMREALSALELLVVIDVVETETTRLAHYVLPASSQFEKWEATFFNLEFPKNAMQLRRPLIPALPGTLPEAEIHSRLTKALGGLDPIQNELTQLHNATAQGREAFAMTFLQLAMQNPKVAALAPVVLYETMGPLLPEGARETAAIWGLAHTCALSYPESVSRAGFDKTGIALGEALFDAILANPSGVIFSHDPYEESFRRIDHKDGRIQLAQADLLAELSRIEQPAPPKEYPLILSAGERRTSTANTIFRDPSWRKKDVAGALRICPADAAELGIEEGMAVTVTTKRGSVATVATLCETVQKGHVTLPNGQGLFVLSDKGAEEIHGAPANELTCLADRDPFAGTPFHKHVFARVSRTN